MWRLLAALERLRRWTVVVLRWLWPRTKALAVWLVRLPGRTVRWFQRHRLWVMTGLAMTAVMLLSAAITLRFALHVREVTVPDLTGLTVSEAGKAAVHSGVDLMIENRFYSTTVPAGRVLSQSPGADAQVRHGWQVRVTESLGPQQVTIPDVVGEQVRDAAMDLRRKSLDLGTQAHIDAPGEPDMVLAQTPPPNAGMDQPRVDLLLSSTSASPQNAFVVPSLVGLSNAAASRAAAEAGLKTAAVWSAPTTAAGGAEAGGLAAGGVAAAVPAVTAGPVGPVTSQSPAAGYRGSKGDTVRLYFGTRAAQ